MWKPVLFVMDALAPALARSIARSKKILVLAQHQSAADIPRGYDEPGPVEYASTSSLTAQLALAVATNPSLALANYPNQSDDDDALATCSCFLEEIAKRAAHDSSASAAAFHVNFDVVCADALASEEEEEEGVDGDDIRREGTKKHKKKKRDKRSATTTPQRIQRVSLTPTKVSANAADAACGCADFAFDMPRDALREKDHLDARFHAKRLAFLAAIKRAYERKGWSVEWCAHLGDALRPCLVVHTSTDSNAHTTIVRIFVVPPDGAIPPNRLTPEAGNCRSRERGQQMGPRASSPHYNASLAFDVAMKQRAADAAESVVGENAADALVLLQRWASRRGHAGADAPIPTEMLCHVVANVASSRGPEAAPLALVRLAMLELAKLSPVPAAPPSHAELCLPNAGKAPPRPVYNADGHGDQLYRCTAGDIAALAEDARYAAAVLLHPDSLAHAPEACVLACFEAPVAPQLARCDLALHVRVDDDSAGASPEPSSASSSSHSDMPDDMKFRVDLEATARRALGPRAARVHAPPAQAGAKIHGICVQLTSDPRAAYAQVDVGPSAADAKASRSFRAFWGKEACTLRRFQDGSVHESVSWLTDLSARHAIPFRSLAHALARHCRGTTEVRSAACAQLDGLLRESSAGLDAGSAHAKGVVGAFDRLAEHLRSVEVAPLRVSSVQPLSAALRRTDALPPTPSAAAGGAGGAGGSTRVVVPVEALVTLESSGRWPDDLRAIRTMEAAAALQLSSALHERFGLTSVASRHRLDVFVEGFAFRLIVRGNRGDVTAATLRANPALRLESREAELALADVPLFSEVAAYHGAVLAVVNSVPAYAPAVRLLRRWLGAHLLLPAVSQEATELIVAAALSSTRSCATSCMNRISLLRDALALIGAHECERDPLVVDLGAASQAGGGGGSGSGVVSALFAEVTASATRKLAAARRSPGGGPGLWICVCADGATGAAATWGVPNRATAARLRRLASAAASALASLSTNAVAGESAEDACRCAAGGRAALVSLEASEARRRWRSVFASNASGLDVLLLVDEAAVPTGAPRALISTTPAPAAQALVGLSSSSSSSKKKRRRASDDGGEDDAHLASILSRRRGAPPLVGFDALQNVLSACEGRFGDRASAFSDPFGLAVGVRWAPRRMMAMPLSVAHASDTVPCENEGEGEGLTVVPDANAMLSGVIGACKGALCDWVNV